MLRIINSVPTLVAKGPKKAASIPRSGEGEAGVLLGPIPRRRSQTNYKTGRRFLLSAGLQGPGYNSSN